MYFVFKAIVFPISEFFFIEEVASQLYFGRTQQKSLFAKYNSRAQVYRTPEMIAQEKQRQTVQSTAGSPNEKPTSDKTS